MAVLAAPKTIQEVAYDLAKENRDSESSILRSYWFDSADEIRLVHVDATTLPNDGRVTPFYFASDAAHDVPYRSAIALVRPEEAEHIALPPGWGDWGNAELWNWK